MVLNCTMVVLGGMIVVLCVTLEVLIIWGYKTNDCVIFIANHWDLLHSGHFYRGHFIEGIYSSDTY